MGTFIIHSTPIQEFQTMIGDIFREEFRKFKPETQAPSPPKEEYLSRREVCEKLKISSTTLYYWTKAGTLQGYRIGSRILYKPDEVKAALCEMANTKNRGRRA